MDTYEKRNLLEKSYQSAVHEAWKQFIANKPIREKDIPPHILRSWKLSREAGIAENKVNPRSLRNLCQTTHESIYANLEQLLKRAYDQLLETENTVAGWKAGA